MLFRSGVVALLVASACASASNTGSGDNSSGDDQPPQDSAPPVDAPPADIMPPVDAPPDTPPAPVTKTLGQTTSTTPTGSNSLVCRITANSTTTENSWYRIYRLADEGITGAFTVSSVSFGVAISETNPVVTVKIGTYAANVATAPTTLDTAQITVLNSAVYNPPPVTAAAPITATVPIVATVQAGGQLVVEVSVPDYTNTRKFWIAGNNGGESRPSWWRAPACSQAQPGTTASAGFAGSHIPITVTGTH